MINIPNPNGLDIPISVYSIDEFVTLSTYNKAYIQRLIRDGKVAVLYHDKQPYFQQTEVEKYLAHKKVDTTASYTVTGSEQWPQAELDFVELAIFYRWLGETIAGSRKKFFIHKPERREQIVGEVQELARMFNNDLKQFNRFFDHCMKNVPSKGGYYLNEVVMKVADWKKAQIVSKTDELSFNDEWAIKNNIIAETVRKEDETWAQSMKDLDDPSKNKKKKVNKS